MNKRILSILLAVLMLVSMIPGTALTAFAASYSASVEDVDFGTKHEGYSYGYYEGEYVKFTNTGTEKIRQYKIVIESGSEYFSCVRMTSKLPEPGETSTDFRVQPVAGLTAGTYKATLKVTSDFLDEPIYANVTFTVVKNAPSASMENIVFASVNEGYSQPAAKTIVVTNDGNLALNSPQVTLISGSENFELGVDSGVPGSLPIGAQTTKWHIKPKAGLTRGTYTATVQVTADELTTPVTATVTFTVGALTYDVSFDANGGTGSMATVTHDTKDGQYTIPACTFTAPEGKVFDYWYMDNANNHLQAGDKVTLSANATLKANWKDDPSIAHEIKVNNGNASVATATQGTTITITAPDVSGKIFTGWTVVKGGISVAQSASATTTFTMPYADVEITANYVDVNVAMPNITFDSVKEQYTQPAAKPISFTNNCGVRLTSPVITIVDGGANFELVTTSVPGNIENGATDNMSYAIKPIAGLARGTYTATIQLAANELVTPITATVTFVVDALTYQVSFDANGGTGSMSPVTHDTKDGQYTIPACTFTAPAGKVFDYWYMDNANNHLQAGDKVTLSANATLKANWKDDLTIPHNIVVNGGTAANSIGTVINQATVDTVVTITAPKLSGKIFTGWVTTSNGVTINHPANETTTFTMPYNDVEITATYTDVSVAMPNISFDTVKEQYTQPAAKAVAFTNNCTVRLTSPVITIASGSEYFELEISSVPGNIDPGATNNLSYAIKPKTGLARGTYNGTIQLTANELVTPIQASVTFKVDALTYDVSFDSNGGTGSMTTVTHDTKDGQYTIPACTFAAPTGKVFDYWYMDNANNHLQAGDKVTLTSNATLKANWKDDLTIPHNIVVNGGTATNSVGTSIDKATVDTVVTITAPKLSGKIFDKWVTTSNGVTINHPTNETTTFTMPYNDVEITATYTDVSVAMPNIVFDSVKEQYVQPAAKSVAFTNNCDVRLTSPVITIASGSEYFELVIGSVPGTIEVGDTNTLSYAIKPKTGLTRGTYTAIVELNANELVTPVQATVTFTVEALTYQVSFDANGGTGSMTAVTHDTKDGQYTIPACAFTAPAGKVFSHWFMDVANNGLQAGDKVTLTSNATLKAEWKDDLSIPHNIVVNGGTAANSVGTAIDKATKDTVVTITAPKLSGKIFDKWVTTSNGVTINHPTEATTTFTMPYNDVEITATYTDVSVAMPNISFDSVKKGYTRPDAKPIAFTNNCEVRLTSPVITIASGSEYFELAIGSVPGAIEAGDTNNLSYAIRPKADLAKGSYTATIKLTANELVDPIEASVTFVVLENDNNGGNNGNNGNDGNNNNNNDNNGGNTDNKPSDNPQTGDNSMMWLWVALLFVSGFGVVGTTVIRRKKYSAR